jgi:hypothetical protein
MAKGKLPVLQQVVCPAGLALCLLLPSACRRTSQPSSADAATASAFAAPSVPRTQRIHLDELELKALASRFGDHELLSDAVFATEAPTSGDPVAATVVFGRGSAYRGPTLYLARKTSALSRELEGRLGGQEGKFREQLARLRRLGGETETVQLISPHREVNPYRGVTLLGVTAFEERESHGTALNDGYRSWSTPNHAGRELLLLTDFQGGQPVTRFGRAFHLIWTEKHRLVQSLASYAIRDLGTLTRLADLREKVDQLQREHACPALADPMEMEAGIAALALQCMLEHDRRDQVAQSVAYPIEVLLDSGVVAKVDTPEKFLSLYDQVIHDGVRAGARAVAADPNDPRQPGAMDSLRLGRAGLVVSQDIGLKGPARIVAVFNDDADVHERMNGKLSTDNRWLWQRDQREVICRTSGATHVFFEQPLRPRVRLTTWQNTDVNFRSRSPSRVLFGLRTEAARGGIRYQLFAPQGSTVYFDDLFENEEYRYRIKIGDDGDDEPCLNHRNRRAK